MSEFITVLSASPIWLFLVGALLVMLIPVATFRLAVTLVVPILAGWMIWNTPDGVFGVGRIETLDIILMRMDPLSRIFGLIFSFAAFLAALYAWHVRDTVQQVATLLYAGSAIGAVFCGDLITLFFFWEGTSLASVFLIWQRGTEAAFRTGMRYLVWQIGSGVILIAGIAIYYGTEGNVSFDKMTGGGPETWTLGVWFIFIAFGIKAAFPLMHNWLQDSYPAATITGAVTLSAFTTKMAIYCLARGFPGTEMLIYIGAVMTLFPIFFAEIENDLRRVLAYSLNNQLGFMVVGVGVGTEMALNGTASHAFAHILYKGLLFMAVGAVMFRTGTSKASELGGLYRTMPWTMTFCIVGAMSISAFPLFSGFIAKSLILDATATEQYPVIWAILVFASAGVLSHSGIKIPYFTFFAHDSGKRPAEAPMNMLLAMGITAAACILVGVFPAPLYAMLPYDVNYVPYTIDHVVGQLQLLMFALLAFALLMRGGFFPEEKRSINLDTDWSYRVFAPAVFGFTARFISTVWEEITRGFGILLKATFSFLESIYGPEGRAAQLQPTGTMVLWLAVLLGAALSVNLLDLR
ncbi:Na(+)/H(+) antiporter subunit D [Ahrensia sp. R2A130]|uniref:Na(+)/H(+) antiporter subunit D n=1 Tax=Ahrensia sp. R2A130 TaxID=744979 RepID=UPI0001E0E0C9|nr:Na(+)/H(+) antiporter subunit D [Ahrensia sp. R2A130]EFL88929.1 putative oxidoreductase [Ahrensia sp. R2A130]